MEIVVPSLEDINAAARQFVAETEGRTVFAFYGRMGAGKTTFIKAVCAELGVAEQVTSPTFAIINEYSSPRGSIYHFDCYRLKSLAEFLDIGGEEYFYSGAPCFIEWPELVEPVLPADALRVNIEELSDRARLIRA
ncbi:MAG: tRNA (adenosine(37)-N6)-threonylcarbamoyltransferase complex ATPase subunit type 1 TsaE [Prevotella sp.]|nr:tRNA (adenosine(37)-N6)-threonylcarbamoyltransferase complex ATPase subunit type 1 TsaE [Prevotella sp.]